MEEVVISRVSTTVPVNDFNAAHVLDQILAVLKNINANLTVLASPPLDK